MQTVNLILNEIRAAKGPKLKTQILEKNKNNELLRKVLYNTYYGRLNYGFSTKMIMKLLDSKSDGIKHNLNIFQLLTLLDESNINNELREKVLYTLRSSGELKDLYIGMLVKDLRLGIGITSINKVMDNLIPVFSVQLAEKYKEGCLEEDEYFFLTEKLNGVRCVSIGGKLISRQDKVFTGMEHIQKDIDKIKETLGLYNLVFDGELIRKNVDNISDNENFRKTIAITNSKDENKEELQYIIFDLLNEYEFEHKESVFNYLLRRKQLDALSNIIEDLGLENIKIVPLLYSGRDKSMITKFLTKITDSGKEGLMLNKDDYYKCERHSGILKVKKMQTVDLRVIDVVEGRRDMEGMLGAVVVNYKGHAVNVGSGFDKEERINFWKNKELIIGKIIEVQYFEETKNKSNNKLSLQFPVYKGVRDDKTEVSYN